MRSAKDASSEATGTMRTSENARSEIIEVLAEAGLGQGHGIEWLIDRFTENRERGK